ncbi:MAG TPA: MBL fold metallo-hydrolase [Xanthobacteraceae bacterium]|nr:MBL fold metallo-hydrolase [Xanthobacteraceae bacterium]
MRTRTMQVQHAVRRTAAMPIVFPHQVPPAPGETIEVAPGILWSRLALPFLLDHVNIYFIDDGDGWALLDTGLGNKATQLAWQPLFDGLLARRPLTRIIATHMHPDHVGAVGFLLQRFRVPLYMSATEYLISLNLHLDPGALEAEHYRRFYLDHGLDAATTERVVTGGHGYLRLVSGLPPTYRRIVGGNVLRIGSRDFDVVTGGGHSPEEVMLLCRAEKLFFSADQVLAKISPNVSVAAVDPEGDPLGEYLRSLQALKQNIAEDVLVHPGHNLPFIGLHTRNDELIAHHDARCGLILDACRAAPRSAAELVPFVFARRLDPHQMGFAFSEVLAHVNYMLRRGTLKEIESADGIRRVVAT